MTAAFGDQAANSDFFFSRLVLSEGSRVRCRRKWVRLSVPPHQSHC